MLIDDIKQRMLAAMKAKRTVEKEVLKVVLGDIQTAEARDPNYSDQDATAVVRKLIKSNRETLAASENAEQRTTLEEEIGILESLLPKALTVQEIVDLLAPSHDAIRAAKNDGQATGVAMKQLKGTDAVVEGKDVALAVKQIRS